MRVLWASHLVPFPPKGGVQQRSYNLLKELAKQHEVHFLGFNQSKLVPTACLGDSLSAIRQICGSAQAISIPLDGQLGRLLVAAKALVSRDTYTIAWLHSKEFAKALLQHLSAAKYDLVHFDTVSLAPYRELLRDARVRTSLTHHNIESDMLIRRASRESSLFKRTYFMQEGRRLQSYERAIAPLFDVHLTCSDLDKQRLEAINPDIRVEVVPNGVDTDYFDPAPFAETGRAPLSLIFAGGLSWYPNASAVRFFVEQVWPSLVKRVPHVRFTVIGKHPPSWLNALATRDPRIQVTGFVDDVRPYLAASELYVCPIFDGGGTKLKVLDALAMGVPMVAHPIACEGIDVEPDRHVLLASTPTEFVEQIIRAQKDATLRQSMSANGRALAVERYDFASIGLSLATLYQEMVSG